MPDRIISHQENGVVTLKSEFSGNPTVFCSPFASSYPLIGVVTSSSAHVLRHYRNEELPQLSRHSSSHSIPTGGSEIKEEASWNFDGDVTGMAWSPRSSLKGAAAIEFCTFVEDKLYYLSKRPEGSEIREYLGTHSIFVNDATFSSLSPSHVASVGDDRKLKIWDLHSEKSMTYRTKSNGVSVRWYEDSSQSLLFIAEESGAITLRDLRVDSDAPSLQFRQSLSAADFVRGMDWNESFPSWIGAVGGNKWLIWDLKKGSAPLQTEEVNLRLPNQSLTSFAWGPNPRTPQQPVFLTSGQGHWQLWGVQQDNHRKGEIVGANRKGESNQIFSGNVSLFSGGPSLVVANYNQLEIIAK
eukprot:CAMPEP_0201491250 /NCGR_PEP_ID=MMETSP0151_2-20130828/29134_1 /ASSEMBLY_ACC=CAM_ASM_000257 /TAXON_ID=200890 /ORGANISM="Paramoeba atlantica, Strain 621/1 / CCAP 1560/9" /LENGTH=354 /DNA_ID=CAMNT_0047877521 /DNA_START=38 /DNA_END=1102 /DNA_ORIENTATION=-